MKKRFVPFILLFIVFLSGCSGGMDTMDRALSLRSRLVSAEGCSFDAEVTADYGDGLYTFSMSCQSDSQGNVVFTVASPESIAGITGRIGSGKGQLTFDGTALAFELLADGQFSPVSAPWLLVHTLCSGYITSCAQTDTGLMVSIDDRYGEGALNLSVYLGQDDMPTGVEILWQGRKILTMTVKNFAIL